VRSSAKLKTVIIILAVTRTATRRRRNEVPKVRLEREWEAAAVTRRP
jgi:hypothetical protein